MPARTTRATDTLDRVGVAYVIHAYAVTEKVGEGYGEAVAAAIGLSADRVFKTLIAEVDGIPVVAVIPVTARLSTRRLARAADGKRAEMMPPAVAERLTGYVTGGISPFRDARWTATSTRRPVRRTRSPCPEGSVGSSWRSRPMT
jgi:Cys-tRNA(Pro)/Cys-tRNA(Cys) deacylase